MIIRKYRWFIFKTRHRAQVQHNIKIINCADIKDEKIKNKTFQILLRSRVRSRVNSHSMTKFGAISFKQNKQTKEKRKTVVKNSRKTY